MVLNNMEMCSRLTLADSNGMQMKNAFVKFPESDSSEIGF